MEQIMENNFIVPLEEWAFIDYQHERNTRTETYFNTNTLRISPEPEVDWDQWIRESALSDGTFNTGLGQMAPVTGLTISSNMAQAASWLRQGPMYPMAQSGTASIADELEQLLFSSSESSQLASTPTTTTSSWNIHSNPNHSSSASSSEPSPSDPNTQAPLWTCTTCLRTFEKRHLLTRHEKTHNPQVFCPHNCGHATACNRDMERHISVHHQAATHPHKCPVRGCVSARDGFTRRDNLVRHLKKVHGRSNG